MVAPPTNSMQRTALRAAADAARQPPPATAHEYYQSCASGKS